MSELKNWPKENIDYCIGVPCEAKAYIFQQIFFLAHYEEGVEAIMTNEKKPLDNCY